MMITVGWTFGLRFLVAIVTARGTDTSAMDAAQALARLMTDNQRFQKNKLRHPDLDPTLREKLVEGQSPFAAILSCSDSRVPPELIFDQGLGDLFEVRLAGNTVTRAGLESIDYAVSHRNAFDHGTGPCGLRRGEGGARRVCEQTGDRIAGDLR